MKSKQFKNYLAGKDINSLSALDEARYMKAQQDKQAFDRKKEDQRALKHNNL